MYTGLLTCAYTDRLSILHVADRVGLCIFQGNQRYDHVDLRVIRQLFILSHDILQQLTVDCQIISTLLKGHAKYLFALHQSRYIIRIDFNDIVLAIFL